MSLVWHIARKDLRRIAALLAVWLASFAGAAAWVRFAPVAHDRWPWDDLSTALSALGVVSAAIVWAQWAVAVVLAAFVVQEDAVAATTAWWKTRPIDGRHVLFAKLTTVLLALVVAPVVVLAPVWIAAGFSGGEVLEAAWDVVKWQSFAAGLGLVVGALTSNLVQFLFTSIALAVGIVLLNGLGRVSSAANWGAIVCWGGAVGGGAALVFAYLQQCRARGWAAIGTTLGVLSVARVLLLADAEPSSASQRGDVQVMIPAEFRARLGGDAVQAIEQRAKKIAAWHSDWIVEPRIIGECALREGEGFSHGATKLRITAVFGNSPVHRRKWFGGQIEERDAWPSRREGSFRSVVRTLRSRNDDVIANLVGAPLDLGAQRTFEDVYLVVLPSFGSAFVLDESLRTTVVRYSIVRSVAQPRYDTAVTNARGETLPWLLDQHDARLVKVRLQKRSANSKSESMR